MEKIKNSDLLNNEDKPMTTLDVIKYVGWTLVSLLAAAGIFFLVLNITHAGGDTTFEASQLQLCQYKDVDATVCIWNNLIENPDPMTAPSCRLVTTSFERIANRNQ